MNYYTASEKVTSSQVQIRQRYLISVHCTYKRTKLCMDHNSYELNL